MSFKPYVAALHREGWEKVLEYIAHATDRESVPADVVPALRQVEERFQAFTQALINVLTDPTQKDAFKIAVEGLRQCIDENNALFTTDQNADSVMGHTNALVAYYQYEGAVIALLKNFGELQTRAGEMPTAQIEAKPFVLKQLTDLTTQVMESKDLAASAQDIRDICYECIDTIQPPELGALIKPGAAPTPHTIEVFKALMTFVNTHIRLEHSAREADKTQNLGRHQRADEAGIRSVRIYNAVKDLLEEYSEEIGLNADEDPRSIVVQFSRAMKESKRYQQACAHGTNFNRGGLAV